MLRKYATEFMLLSFLAATMVPLTRSDACRAESKYNNHDCAQHECCVLDVLNVDNVQYCKPLGIEGAECSVKEEAYSCKCRGHLYCRPNIQSATYTSLYGKCAPNTTGIASPPTTVTTTIK